jgi:hypothetical protein
MVDFAKLLIDWQKTHPPTQTFPKERLKFRLAGKLEDCWSKKKSIVDLVGKVLQFEDGHLAFYLDGGPTGYESFRIDENSKPFVQKAIQTGWTACAGMEKRWDKLEIPAEEMSVVWENIKGYFDQ